MGNYIHINDILNFVNLVERKKFKIINSEDYGFNDDYVIEHGFDKGMSFKAIIPADFEVKSIEFSYDLSGDIFKILDKKGRDAMKLAHVILWNNELYSTEKEKSVCVLDDDIDNGMLIFENFKGIPELVSSSLIMKTI